MINKLKTINKNIKNNKKNRKILKTYQCKFYQQKKTNSFKKIQKVILNLNK